MENNSLRQHNLGPTCSTGSIGGPRLCVFDSYQEKEVMLLVYLADHFPPTRWQKLFSTLEQRELPRATTLIYVGVVAPLERDML